MRKWWPVLLLILASTGCQNEANEEIPRKADYILAISWQPAFCELRPRKKECRTQTKNRYDASHFSLHGLWPQPRQNVYCGVNQENIDLDKDGKWLRLEKLKLTPENRKKLQKLMPGYQSGLHRHEWIKHGTCYREGDAETYYQDSVWLMQTINSSKLAQIFAQNVGSHVTTDTIRSALDSSFGAGAGNRVRVKCSLDKNSNRRIIVELTLALAGDIGETRDLSALILAAFPDKKKGCPGGIVDPVGLQ